MFETNEEKKVKFNEFQQIERQERVSLLGLNWFSALIYHKMRSDLHIQLKPEVYTHCIKRYVYIFSIFLYLYFTVGWCFQSPNFHLFPPNVTMVIMSKQFSFRSIRPGHVSRNEALCPCVHFQSVTCLFMLLLE